MYGATTADNPVMGDLGLSGHLFRAISGGLRVGCGLLSTGRRGLGRGGGLLSRIGGSLGALR